jgi:signal transduction histidine kinase/CheY-like chemotaxis protein/CHASE3 domain sensor protein
MANIFQLKRRLRFGFFTAIVLVVIVGGISLLTFKNQAEQSQLVNKTYRIINHAEGIEKLLVDMETGRRGFRSTNQRIFLEPYNKGLLKVEPAFNQLFALIENNTEAELHAKQMKVQADSLLQYWGSLGLDAGSYTRDDIAGIQFTEKQMMDRFRNSVSALLQKETQLLSQREIDNRKTISYAIVELIIGIILILVVVIILIYQILKEFKNRTNTEKLLQQKNEQLLHVNEEREERNWLLAGVAELNNASQGHTDIESLTQSFLQSIVHYIGAQAAGIYVLDEEENKLVRVAQFALPSTAKHDYDPGEGFIGQAALESRPLVIDNIPASQLTIETGVVKANFAQGIYVPVKVEKQVKAVLELLCFEACGEKSFTLLQMVSNNLAIAIHSVQSHDKVKKLLEQVQQQKEELVHQQEELRQVNEELSLQAEVLQTSEEELRVQEEELRQINAELEKKNEAVETARSSLEGKTRELESISRYKTDFLANMSHELRTPLNSVLILAKLLADNSEKNLTEKQVAHAKIIYKSGSDLLQLINDILDLSKIEAGKVDMLIEEVSLKEIMNDMQQMFTMVAEEKQIEYEINLPENVTDIIRSDKQKIEQVLKNLLSNAFKFTSAKGKVKLAVDTVHDEGAECISFTVTDTGIGIAPGKQKIIFEAFQQADSSTSRKYGGTGLGLSIISRLVQMLKGKVMLQSAEGLGSSFTVILPVDTATATPLTTAVMQPVSGPNSIEVSQVREQQVIPDDRHDLQPSDNVMLIIEDDPELARILKQHASSHHYKAIVALQGDEGLYCVRKYNPTIIILDLNLPVISGNTILQTLKNDPELKHIPVHVISAAENQALANSGALAFLPKPFEKQQMEQAFTLIDEYLRSTIKRVLIISTDESTAQQLRQLISKRSPAIKFDIVPDPRVAATRVTSVAYDIIIADLSTNFEEGLAQLKWLNNELAERTIPTIICIDQDITPAGELELKKISKVVLRKSVHSNDRLLDELELFLYKVKEDKDKPPSKYLDINGANQTLAGKHVLLVDDDMRNVFALTAALEKEKMHVITATDGREAIELLRNNNEVALVLMDIMMPELDGYEAMRMIRKELKLIDLPIIALTAKAMAGDKEKCIEAGASDYITKPVDVQKLISLIRVWMS